MQLRKSGIQSRSPLVLSNAELRGLDGGAELDLAALKSELLQNSQGLLEHVAFMKSLETQLETVRTNLGNYRDRLEDMAAKGLQQGPVDLQMLHRFEERIGQRYLNQIDRDIVTLGIRLRSQEQRTETIRGLVELEQAERDRQWEAQNQRFQNTIAIVGVGLGSASIAAANLKEATVVQALVDWVPEGVRGKEPSPWLLGAIAVGVCLGLGCLAAVVLQGLSARGRRR